LITIIDSDIFLTGTTISNTTLVGGNQASEGAGIYATNSNIDIETSTFMSLKSSLNGGAIWLIQTINYRQIVQNKLTLTDSTFTNNTCSTNGGAIYTSNADILVSGGTYSSNSATSGGVVYLSCNVNTFPYWDYQFTSMNATDNSASDQGGVINTDLHKPTISNMIFANNTARYGADFAAFPLDIVIEGAYTEEVTFVSGKSIDSPLIYTTFDFFSQVVSNMDNQLGALEVDSKDVSLSEETRTASKSGVFTFTQTVIIGQPGFKGILKFITTAIDLNKYKVIKGQEYTETIVIFNFDIRFWVRGEAQNGLICVDCEAGSYTLVDNATFCITCPENAYCPGKDRIIVDK
jgi:predicted outer membrane repeat protein